MLSRAEEHFDAIRNYYHIIDPEGMLSEIKRAKKEAEVLNDMPNSFPKALCYAMKLSGCTKEALAFESKVSESTIGRYRTGKVKHYSEKNIVALCVAMHLPPWLSFSFIEKAGFALAKTEEQQAFMTVLNCMYMKSVDEVDEYLKARGNEPLVQVAA